MPIPRAIARMNRYVTNPLTRRFAGRLPGFGIVIHRGRKSGRVYRTPVNVFREGETYRIALTYGPDAQWVKNVLAAGHFDIETRGQKITLGECELINEVDTSWAPPVVRQVLRAVNATYVLECKRQ